MTASFEKKNIVQDLLCKKNREPDDVTKVLIFVTSIQK